MAKSIDPAADIRAEEQALARRKAEHDAEKLTRAAELIAQIGPIARELGVLAGQIVAPYVSDHLTAVAGDVDRARMAVTQARVANDATLSEG